jgi:hypothetical protein
MYNVGELSEKLYSDDRYGKNQTYQTVYMKSCVHFDAHLQRNIVPVTPCDKQNKISILPSVSDRRKSWLCPVVFFSDDDDRKVYIHLLLHIDK